MLKVDVEFVVNGQKIERTFRTNDSGNHMFVGVSENKQISCESGFHRIAVMKKAIRKYIVEHFGDHGEAVIGRIKYLHVSAGFHNC